MQITSGINREKAKTVPSRRQPPRGGASSHPRGAAGGYSQQSRCSLPLSPADHARPQEIGDGRSRIGSGTCLVAPPSAGGRRGRPQLRPPPGPGAGAGRPERLGALLLLRVPDVHARPVRRRGGGSGPGRVRVIGQSGHDQGPVRQHHLAWGRGAVSGPRRTTRQVGWTDGGVAADRAVFGL